MLLPGCSTINSLVTNEVPQALLIPEPMPTRPNVNTGNSTRDFKNGTVYIYELERTNNINIAKLNEIASILKK